LRLSVRNEKGGEGLSLLFVLLLLLLLVVVMVLLLRGPDQV
jgi:hypothetical protein